jgi:L-ascorbate metabolism protein UlaG (beta-lactamase superfamily)
MTLVKSALLVAVFLCCYVPGAGANQPLEITYLGNEGFLVRGGSQAVLFDALFGAGLPDYDRVPAETVRDMEAARRPFEHIDVVFISHIHPDHFELHSTLRFLKSHPATIVVSPIDVAAQLKRALAGNDRLRAQIRGIAAHPGRIIGREEGGIHVGIFPLAHGDVENLAYLVDLGGWKVLHLGDADLPMEGIGKLNLSENRIDIAFLPYWQLTENAERVRDQIRAKVIVPMHLITNATTPASKEYLDHLGGMSGMLAKIHSEFPNAVVFRTPLESRTF